jgi:hypothetical protein
MGKTKRKARAKARRREREAEAKFEQEYQQRRVEDIRIEAEGLINEQVTRTLAPTDQRELDTAIATEKAKRAERINFSVQAPPYDEPVYAPGLIWWTGTASDKYVPVEAYNNPKRQEDLSTFALLSPLLLNAEAVLIKKVSSLSWFVESGKTTARHWQQLLLDTENFKGWDRFVSMWVRAYSESDRGGYAEIIRAAPSWAVDEFFQLTPRGEAAFTSGNDKTWPISDLRVLDPTRCWPSNSITWPLMYDSPYTGKKHRLRKHQFMHLLDMPAVDVRFAGMGVCAASRAVFAAQEDRMITRYFMEKMSENPGAGIVTANVNQKLLSTALKAADTERQARGVIYYKGLIFLPVLDPSGRFSLDFLSFSGLPDNFDHGQTYNILKETVASAFGIDVLELGSMPGNQLGSAQQATVMSKKSRGKGVGTIVQGIERQFRQRLLPANARFQFSSQDLEEKRDKAEIDNIFFKNAGLMVRQIDAPSEMAIQYLIDSGTLPKEYLSFVSGEDVTTNEIIEDIEAPLLDKSWKLGELVQVYKDGSMKSVVPISYRTKQIERVVPDGKPLPPATRKDAEFTKADNDAAHTKFNRDFPDLAGLLEAE